MRTTISIDDRLLDDLKRQAAERRTTVSRLIEDSVRLVVGAPHRPIEPTFELVTFGKGGRFTNRDVDRSWTLVEQEDVERYGTPR